MTDATTSGPKEARPARSRASATDRALTLALFTATLALVATLVGQCYEDAQRRQDRRADIRREAQREAVAAILDIGQRLNDAYHPAALFVAAERSGARADSLRKLRKLFQGAVAEWDRYLDRSRLLVTVYLGDTAAKELEGIHQDLQGLDARLAAAIPSAVPVFRTRLGPEYQDTTQLPAELRAAVRQLLIAETREKSGVAAIAANDAELRRVTVQLIDHFRVRLYLLQRKWAHMIQSRRAGSFDPFAELLEGVRQAP